MKLVKQIPLVGCAYQFPEPQASAQTAINWYPSPQNPTRQTIYNSLQLPTPGCTAVTSITSQGSKTVRWMDYYVGVWYAVIGAGFYSINTTTFAQTLLGTINTNTGYVRAICNNLQIQLNDGVNGWVYTIATQAFTEILTVGTDATYNLPYAFVPGQICTYKDGYGVVLQPNSNTYQVSQVNDFTDYAGGLWTGAFSLNGDNLVSAIQIAGYVIMLGQKKGQFFQDNNTNPNIQPFQPVSGMTIERGCAAPLSLVECFSTAMWLSQSSNGGYQFVMLQNNAPVVISDDALSQTWSNYATVSDAVAIPYTWQGHEFCALTFPSMDVTWTVDLTTWDGHDPPLWHQWATSDSNGIQHRHLANCAVFINGNTYIGGYNTDLIYQLSSNVFTDNGQPIIRERIWPTQTNLGMYTSYESLTINCNVGQGLSTGQGVYPVLMISFSGDQGETWGPETYVPLGSAGNYQQSVFLAALGTYRYLTIKTRLSDPVYCALFGAYVMGVQDEYFSYSQLYTSGTLPIPQ